MNDIVNDKKSIKILLTTALLISQTVYLICVHIFQCIRVYTKLDNTLQRAFSYRGKPISECETFLLSLWPLQSESDVDFVLLVLILPSICIENGNNMT